MDHRVRPHPFSSRNDTGPPGQMKAISGAKLKPTDQGPLTGVLKDLGFDENQVGCVRGDVVMAADEM